MNRDPALQLCPCAPLYCPSSFCLHTGGRSGLLYHPPETAEDGAAGGHGVLSLRVLRRGGGAFISPPLPHLKWTIASASSEMFTGFILSASTTDSSVLCPLKWQRAKKSTVTKRVQILLLKILHWIRSGCSKGEKKQIQIRLSKNWSRIDAHQCYLKSFYNY